MWKKLCAFGMLGAIAYLLHVVIGGFLWAGYNHLMQPISDLTATGAPDRIFISYFTDIYAACSIIFAFCALMLSRKLTSKKVSIGFFLFLLMHIVSAAYKFFPEDLAGSAITFTGIMHIVVTAAVVPLAIAAPIVVGFGLRKVKELSRYSVYSIVTGCICFVAGGLSVILMANKLPFFGLVERINIGTLQLWMFIMSLKLFTTDLTCKLVGSPTKAKG